MGNWLVVDGEGDKGFNDLEVFRVVYWVRKYVIMYG